MSKFRKFHVKEDFFETWSSDMAYTLGFVATDGYVSHSTLQVGVQERDISVLQYLKSRLCPLAKIEFRPENRSCRVRFNSVHLVESLKKFSIVPAKSFTIRANFPIPQEYIGDFIRGVFDGDGWVCCRRNTIESGVVSASKGFLEDIRRLTGIQGRLRRRRKKGYKTFYYVWEMSKGDSLKLKDLMYHGCGFCLWRKKKRFDSNFFIPSTRWWMKEQIELVRDNPTMPLRELCVLTGKSYKAVAKKRWELK